MRGFLLPLFLFYCVLGADNRQLQPKVTETVRQCDTQALWWDITESASQDVLFELEFTAFQAAQWQVTVVKRSFSANTNVSIVDHSYDCSLVQWTVKPEELNVIKRQEFGCGDMNGRWWVIVKHDAQRARDFVLNLNTRKIERTNASQLVPLPIGKSKDEAKILAIKGPDSVKAPLESLQIPTFAVGSRVIVECKPINAKQPMRYLSYNQLPLPGGCSLQQSNTGSHFELGNCQASRPGTWMFTVETEPNVEYHVRAYLLEPKYQNITLNQKYTITLLRELDTIYFRLPSIVWSMVPNSTSDSLVPVVDNVINGRVRLASNYDDIPFDTCRDYSSQCTTEVGCHLLLGPCEHNGRHDRTWIFGVEALKFHQENVPITITFSVKVAPYNLLPLGVGPINGTKTGALDNGILAEYFLPASNYLLSNTTGSWITISVYVDAAKRFQERGGSLNGYLYISDKAFSGPNEGCHSNKRFCSVAETSTDYMSCAIQLDPCALQTYPKGLYVSLLAVDVTDELWYQEKLPYTLRVEKDDPLDKAQHLLDDGNVITDTIMEGHYKFFYIPPHRGSLTVSISSPWDRVVPPSGVDCSSLTKYGVNECVETAGCGWCTSKCVPCSGKVGQSIVCENPSILGCIAPPPPTPTPAPVPSNSVNDPCSSLESSFCSDPNLAGVCGWCNSLQLCGSCSRTLAPESWCGVSIPANCKDVRKVISKRAVQETQQYGGKEVRLIVVYGNKVEGPSCPCWKPNASVDVRKGETIHTVVSSCAADLSQGLYVGVQGIVPTPANTSWTCITGYTTPVRLNVAGVVECMSFNGQECYWGDGPCTAKKLLGNGSPIIPLSCIDVRRQIYGSDGYSYEGKWCDDTLKYFLDKFHRYNQNKFVLSVEQAPPTSTDQVTRLAPNIVQEDSLNSGDTHFYELIFPRSDLLNSSLIIDTRAHANAGFEFTYGLLKGQSGANYDCLELDEPQVCVPSDKNKGQCVFLFNSCNWKNDRDSRRMMIKVKRTSGTLGESGPVDLYNINYILSSKVPINMNVAVLPMATTLFAKEYAHFQYTVSKDQINAFSSLIVEVYFDASRELDPMEQIELFMNNPNAPEPAGDLNDCYCHQTRWTHPKRIVAIIQPCDLIEGTYRFSVRTNLYTRDSFRAKFTINAYVKKMVKSLPWDTLMDGSMYVGQTSHYSFYLAQSFISGDRDGFFKDTSNILTFRVYSVQPDDKLTLSLRSGNATCGCGKEAVKSCTTQLDATGRPFCQFTIEYCQLVEAGDYYLSVSAKSSKDSANSVPYTLSLWRTNKNKEVIKMTSADSCSTSDRSDSKYSKFVILENNEIQHFNLTFKNKGTNLIPQIYLDGVKYGTVIVSTNTVKKLATPECHLENLAPFYCAQSSCVIKLACGDDVGLISVKAVANKASQPVLGRLSICSGDTLETRFTGSPKEFSLPAYGFEIITITRFATADATVWSAIFRYEPRVPADGKVTMTISQGMCSTCGGYTKTKVCVGPCQMEIHYWDLPANYDKTEWFIHFSNENPYPLSFSLTSTRSTVPGVNNLAANSPAVAQIGPLAWVYFRFTVNAPNYWEGLEVTNIDMQFTGAVLPSQQTHGVSYVVSNKVPTIGARMSLTPLPMEGKLFELGKCCVAKQTFYILVFNSNPIVGWNIRLNGKFNQLSSHTSLSWLGTQATGNILARPVDSRPAADRAFGPINYQGYVNFPGIFSPDGTFPTGAYLRAYTNRDKTVNPSLEGNIHFYMNTNTPAGNSDCFSNLYYERSPEFWSKQWFHCEAQRLGVASYWFGIVSLELGLNLQYNVGLQRIDPVKKDFGVEFVDRAPPQEWKQYEYAIESKAALGLRYVLDVAVTDNFGAVKVAMNLEAPAAEVVDKLPCSGEWLDGKVAKAHRVKVQQCDSYLFEGKWVKVCYDVTIPGTGRMVYDSCDLLTVSKGQQLLKQPAKRLYLGVKPYCNIQAQPDPTFAATTRCSSTAPENPTYTVKLTVEDTLAGSRVQLDEGIPYRLNRYVFQDANTAIFRYRAPSGVLSSYGFIVIEATSINDNVPLTIGWSTDGCNFNRKDTVCSNDEGAMRCSLLIYPCNWLPGARYDLSVTAPTAATTGFTLKATAVTNIDSYMTKLYLGDSATISVGINELKFFHVDMTTNKGIQLEAADRVIVELVEVGCGTVNAWINRESPGGPQCNVNPGGRPCTNSSCVLMDINACDILNTDNVFEYYVSVVGVTRTSASVTKAKLRVRVIKSSPVPTKIKMIYDNEEHPILASVVAEEPACASISEAQLPTQDDCCSLTPPLPGANDTRSWRVDNTHFLYTVVGGHHLGNGAGLGTRFTVGLRSEVESALVYFSTDKAKFCESSPPTPCRVTETDRCVFEIRTCRQTVRQLYIWIDPNSIRWYNAAGRPNVPPQQSTYQIGWVRATKQEVSIVSVKREQNLAPHVPVYHPFWLMPGEITYLKIEHPESYATNPTYHVRIAVDGVTNGPVTIAQASGWNSCRDGECVVQDCSFGDVENDQAVGQCRKKTANCICQNLKDISLPICLTEQVDYDRADYFQLQAPRVGTLPIYGRLKITLNEQLIATNSTVCHSVRTGQHRYFKVPPLGGSNYIYKLTVHDMDDDFGAVRMSLNDETVAVPGTCAEKSTCRADGGSCTIYYRKGNSTPGITITGDPAIKVVGINGIHKFRVDLTSVPVTIYDLVSTVTSASPSFTVNGKCLTPTYRQYYRLTTKATDNYVLIHVVSHVATVWVSRGSLSHARGEWTCNTRNKGFCEILIACTFKGGDIYYIHVEGGAHEITASAYPVVSQSFNIGETKDFAFSSPQPFSTYVINGVEGRHQDPTRYFQIQTSGPIADSWITKGSFGSSRCKVPNSFVVDNQPGNVLNKQTWTHRVPSCYISAQSDSFYLNILSVDSECDGYIYHVNSYFSEPDGALLVNGVGPSKIPAGGIARHRVDRGILGKPLGDHSVLLVRIRDASSAIESFVYKSNYLISPNCQSGCTSTPTSDSVYWLDNCWHCGGDAYDTVFVELKGKKPTSTEIIYNLSIEHKVWTELTNAWIQNTFDAVARDYHFFRVNLKKQSGMMIEIEVLGNLGVDIEIYPTDCGRRNLQLALSDQALLYKCYPAQGTCQIPFSKEHNWGSSSSQANYIWSDDNIRILVKGYATSFRIRVRRGAEDLCSPVTQEQAPFCAKLIPNGLSWGNSENFNAKDRWAERWFTKLVEGFDCPVDRNCDCRPVSATCRAAIKEFICGTSFGNCTSQGWKTGAHVDKCRAVEQACYRTFGDAGFPQLDCRHSFYDGARLLTDGKGCALSGCPPVIPPEPVPNPEPKPTPIPPEPPIIYPEPALPPPPNGTEPEVRRKSGLALVVKLGIVLGVVSGVFVLTVVGFFVKRHFAAAA